MSRLLLPAVAVLLVPSLAPAQHRGGATHAGGFHAGGIHPGGPGVHGFRSPYGSFGSTGLPPAGFGANFTMSAPGIAGTFSNRGLYRSGYLGSGFSGAGLYRSGYFGSGYFGSGFYGSGFYGPSLFGSGFAGVPYAYPVPVEVPVPRYIDPPIPLPGPQPATLVIRFPASAEVWVDGEQVTGGPHMEWTLRSSVLTQGDRYTFRIRAQWATNGRRYEYAHDVAVQYGAQSRMQVLSGTAIADR